MKVGFLGMLGLIFIVLKLTKVIAWSWWLVLLPIYGGFAVFFGIALIVFLVGLIRVCLK